MNTLRIKKIITFILLLTGVGLNAQITNFRIHPSLNPQIEPSVSRHPENELIMFASAYTITAAFRSEGVYVSTDGGFTWHGSDTCNSGSSTNNHGGDPGPVIDRYGNLILTHQGGFITGMFSNTSSNLGASWTTNYQIASGDQDKGTPGTDDVNSSSYYGRSYLVWTKYLSPFPIVISYTTNSGINWNSVIQINSTPSGYYSLGSDIKVNNQGVVYVCWAAAITTSPQNEKFCGFAKSNNGGVSWDVNENAFEMNGVKTSSLQPWNIRINGYPHIETDKTGSMYNGFVYIVTGEKNLSPAGTDPDIIFHRSTDGGNTWSEGIRVNQDPLNNGKVQYFPAICTDENGGINVIYYDNRNISSDSMDVYLSRSTDAGLTWHDYRINQFRFVPKTVIGSVGAGNQGDNIAVIFTNGKLQPMWMADYTGVYQIWSAMIDINTIGINQITNELPGDLNLLQNYPNPFNPETIINFSLPHDAFTKLIISDITGKQIAELLNKYTKAGYYSFPFNAGNLTGGIYFYTLVTENNGRIRQVSKKMLLVK